MTTELLTDAGHTREDLRMVETAIRKGWQIPEQLLEALPRVAGAMALKGKPRDQLAAMKVLLAMRAQNSESDAPKPQLQTTINVGVNVDNRTDERRNLTLAIAERVRAGRILHNSDDSAD